MDKATNTSVRQIPVHQVLIGDLYLAEEAPKGSNLKVRDAARDGWQVEAELKASLEHVGLINPLVFKVIDDKFYVIAGNRRLKLLREILAGHPDALVECHNVADYPANWRQIAIDTNLSVPPHPVERYEQIVAIASDMKLSPEDVCQRFGLTTRSYNRIMALGGMAPQIRAKWRDGEIDYNTAQLFTLEPSHKEQVRLYDAVEKQNGRVYEHTLRMRIVPEAQRDSGKFVQFVGIDRCKELGLIKQEDFFSSNHIVTDPKKLAKIVQEMMEAKCIVLRDHGWSWALPENVISANERWSYQQLEPKGSGGTKAELAKRKDLERRVHEMDYNEGTSFEDMEAELEQLNEAIAERGYTDEQKAKTGCIVKINHKGEYAIEYGRMKPSEARKIQASEQPKPAKKKDGGEPAINNSLAMRLSEGLQHAIAEAMEKFPQIATAALIAAAGSTGELLDIKIKSPQWRDGKETEKDFLQLFEGAADASPSHQIVMLTKVAMEAIDIITHSADRPPLARKTLQALVAKLPAAAVNRSVAAHFDANGYFKGVSLETIVGAVRCSLGEDHAGKVAKMKKGDAVKFAIENVIGKGWLPNELRTIHYKGPVEAAKKPAAPKSEKKVKPVKKAAAKAAKKGKK